MKKAKFSVFTDLHHAPKAFMNNAFSQLDFIQKRAKDENSDFIIHAGDLCHDPAEVSNFIEKYNNFDIPSYNCLGNHDSDHTEYKKTLELYNMNKDYYFFDNNGYRFIVLNPNYYENNGEYINYSLRNYLQFGGALGCIPPFQLEWLEQSIETSPYPCILISHQSFERDVNGITNAKEVRDLIDTQNKNRKHSVILCINGHYHIDHFSIINNVLYFDLNSCSYSWVDVPHNFYSDDINAKHSAAKHTININDAIHAVITLCKEEFGGIHIKIDGMSSSCYMGVTYDMTDNPTFDLMGRAFQPRVSSLDITIN